MSRHMIAFLAWTVMQGAAVASPAPDFARFWQQTLLQQQSFPPQPQFRPDGVTFATIGGGSCRCRAAWDAPAGLAPVLYLLDRAAPATCQPAPTHQWVMLDVAALWAGADLGPDPTHHPLVPAVQTAHRALSLLLSRPGAPPRAGLVGEGRGGAVALALAALAPDRVAFVAAHEPCGGAQPQAREVRRAEQRYARWGDDLQASLALCDLRSFAAQVACPVLLTAGAADAVVTAEEVAALQPPRSPHTRTLVLARARHCQPDDLREWWSLWREWASELPG